MTEVLRETLPTLIEQIRAVSKPVDNEPTGFVEIGEACRYTGFSKRYIYNMVSEKRIPFYKINHTLKFDLQELEL